MTSVAQTRTSPLSACDAAIEHLRDGRPIVMSTRGSTSLAYRGADITTAQMAHLIRVSTGFVQVALAEQRCDELLLPLTMTTPSGKGSLAYGQCVTVDAAQGITTGISAADRAQTTRALCDPMADHSRFTRPGHVVPVRGYGAARSSSARLADVLVTLTSQLHGPHGAAYAELVSVDDSLVPVCSPEAHRIAESLNTVLLRY